MAVSNNFMKEPLRKQFLMQWTPAAAAVTETTKLKTIPAGWRVKCVDGDLVQASDAAGTVVVGYSGTTNAFVLTTDKACNGTPGAFQGLGTGQNLGGKLMVADTDVNVVYTANGGETIKPIYNFRITCERSYGNTIPRK